MIKALGICFYAPLQNKTAEAVAHAFISKLICSHSTPCVLLSDNGVEFRNALLEEICKQFNINQPFTVTYHPLSNWLVECANREIFDVLRPIVGLVVVAIINSSGCESTGKTPYSIVYGREKRLPYDFLDQPQKPVYNIIEDQSKRQLNV